MSCIPNRGPQLHQCGLVTELINLNNYVQETEHKLALLHRETHAINGAALVLIQNIWLQ